MSYTMHVHQHNFCAWAASRAAQRAFTSSKVLIAALEETNISQFIEKGKHKQWLTSADFDADHRIFCSTIINFLDLHLEEAIPTYGRAAKLLNVYLKGMLIIGQQENSWMGNIHPPIDRILLQNLKRLENVDQKARIHFDKAWTTYTEEEYFHTIELIRGICGGKGLWVIEENWKAS